MIIALAAATADRLVRFLVGAMLVALVELRLVGAAVGRADVVVQTAAEEHDDQEGHADDRQQSEHHESGTFVLIGVADSIVVGHLFSFREI